MASSGTGLFHVDAIVLDEVHYLSDISRGTVWEEIVSSSSTLFLLSSKGLSAECLKSDSVFNMIRSFIAPRRFNLYAYQPQLQTQTN